MKQILGFLFIIVLAGVAYILWRINKSTPLPEGCEDLRISEEKCSTCKNTSCGLRNNKE